MKKVLILCAALLALAGATGASSGPTATVPVSITSTGFVPREVVVNPGDTVTWRNNDTAPHQVVSNTGAFPASPVLDPKETYSFRFGTPAAYAYHDGRKPSSEGAVIVRGAGTVTIGVSRLQLVYRNPVRVFGIVGSARAGESVAVTIGRYGTAPVTKTLTTDSDGTFEFEDRPGIRTAYEASWRGGKSDEEPSVNVRPLVVFDVLSARNNRFRVRVRAARSYAGKVVRIQRRTTAGEWKTTKRVRLNARGQARFRGKFPRGKTLARAWVAPAPGYLDGFSITKTVRR